MEKGEEGRACGRKEGRKDEKGEGKKKVEEKKMTGGTNFSGSSCSLCWTLSVS